MASFTVALRGLKIERGKRRENTTSPSSTTGSRVSRRAAIQFIAEIESSCAQHTGEIVCLPEESERKFSSQLVGRLHLQSFHLSLHGSTFTSSFLSLHFSISPLPFISITHSSPCFAQSASTESS